MSASLARLRKRAAEFEQKKQFDRALEVYVQILDEGGKELDDEDVPLFNRVGDMLMRKGSVTEALGYYERAVDVYAERGYLNNAIALCSKILRQSPGRAAVYYKLARISARKGFKSDARKNFLEYADRMQKLGMADEAFRALKEFASLYPDQDDVRLVLAELLSKENRKGEALEQLQSLYQKLQSEGRAAEARATIDRMRAIDPTVTPREGTTTQSAAMGDLVFLDLTDADGSGATPHAGNSMQPKSARAPVPSPVPALDGLAITFFPDETEAPHPEGFESTAVETEPVHVPPVERSLTPRGTELVVATSVPDETADEPPIELLPEPEADTADTHGVDDQPASLERIEGLIDDLVPEPGSTSGQKTPRSTTPLSSYQFADIELDDVPRESADREHDLALPGGFPSAPFDTPATPLPSLDSAAAADDARAAAEEAADLAADVAAREAAQARPPADLPPITPLVSPQPDESVTSSDTGPDETHGSLTDPRTTAARAGITDDFLASPPSFGSSSSTPTDYAFPPLPGLDDAVSPDAPSDAETEPEPALESALAGVQGTVSIGGPESHLRSRLEIDPENWDLRRQLGEVLLDAGDRDDGLYELELAMAGYELRGDLSRAQEVVDEILRVSPGSVSHHQKRVEYAVKSRDRQRLTDSYLELADALFRSGSADKAVAVYSRVLEHDAANERAEFALATLAPERLEKLRGVPSRPGRWSDELAAIHGNTPASESAQPPAQNGAVVPDDSAAGKTPTHATAPGSPQRVRFASIELPVPDWGEGVPRTKAVSEPAPEPASHVGTEGENPADAPVQSVSADSRQDDEPPEQAAGPAEEGDDPESSSEPETRIEERREEAWTPVARDATPRMIPQVADTREPLADLVTPESSPSTRPAFSRPTPISISSTSSALPHAPQRTSAPRGVTPVPVPAITSDSPLEGAESDFVDLGEWLRNTEPPRSTRMQVEDPKPTGDEQADFEEMLRRFKRGVAANVEAEDYDAHYDLGVAYKEMGLVDEAIAQFQKALRGVHHRVRSYEALGQCFVEKEQFAIAAALLQRATEVPGSDDQQLVGVLYLLGFAKEQMGHPEEALPYYLRVFAVDIEFRDVAERVAALGNATK